MKLLLIAAAMLTFTACSDFTVDCGDGRKVTKTNVGDGTNLAPWFSRFCIDTPLPKPVK